MPKQIGGLDPSVLTAALEGLEAQKKRLEEHIAKVRSLLGLGSGRRGRPPKAAAAIGEAAAPGRRRKRRKFSAETRARMAEAQRKRWAGVKKATK